MILVGGFELVQLFTNDPLLMACQENWVWFIAAWLNPSKGRESEKNPSTALYRPQEIIRLILPSAREKHLSK